MDYLRPATAPTHGDDRLRIAGTLGVVEHQEGRGLTLVTTKLPVAGTFITQYTLAGVWTVQVALDGNQVAREYFELLTQ